MFLVSLQVRRPHQPRAASRFRLRSMGPVLCPLRVGINRLRRRPIGHRRPWRRLRLCRSRPWRSLCPQRLSVSRCGDVPVAHRFLGTAAALRGAGRRAVDCGGSAHCGGSQPRCAAQLFQGLFISRHTFGEPAECPCCAGVHNISDNFGQSQSAGVCRWCTDVGDPAF